MALGVPILKHFRVFHFKDNYGTKVTVSEGTD